MTISFTIRSWEVTLMVWIGLAPIFGGRLSRKRVIGPVPVLRYPATPVDMAYAEAYCPIGGIAFEVWLFDEKEDS